ncbi:MAG: hypothetical protein RIS76_1393 [Verrucomicrobiota bacterium]|jgi:hypothetical protein
MDGFDYVAAVSVTLSFLSLMLERPDFNRLSACLPSADPVHFSTGLGGSIG